MIKIRLAQENDIGALCALDHVAQVDHERCDLIRRAVTAGECSVAVLVDGKIVGYAILNYHFFSNGFVELLYAHPDHRRKGVGAALMQHLAGICRTEKLFTSTNLSNLPMQSLLANLGYRLSGVVHDLDEGDPELFYVKLV
jgi:GNAT superfamily N-acetyltransferase